ncbi:MAG: peroxiredoxin [Rickettsiales bacterium]|jgi:thioredoxin-dependent peroxiredoxin|nr:peroxiredoxin [Rickettsiales bacterium]
MNIIKQVTFSLPGNDNKDINLSDYKEKKNIVLYFYPKDNTPGCTQESKDFRDFEDKFSALDTVIIGVSKDSVTSHNKFRAKYSLPFDLVSDEKSELCNQYGVWVEKSMFGKKYMGIERSTFLINKNQEIVKEWRKVKVKNHVEDVLTEVGKL